MIFYFNCYCYLHPLICHVIRLKWLGSGVIGQRRHESLHEIMLLSSLFLFFFLTWQLFNFQMYIMNSNVTCDLLKPYEFLLLIPFFPSFSGLLNFTFEVGPESPALPLPRACWCCFFSLACFPLPPSWCVLMVQITALGPVQGWKMNET